MLELSRSLILISVPVNAVRMYGAAQLPVAVPPEVSQRPMYRTLGSETEPSPVAALAGGAATSAVPSTARAIVAIHATRASRCKAPSLLVAFLSSGSFRFLPGWSRPMHSSKNTLRLLGRLSRPCPVRGQDVVHERDRAVPNGLAAGAGWA